MRVHVLLTASDDSTLKVPSSPHPPSLNLTLYLLCGCGSWWAWCALIVSGCTLVVGAHLVGAHMLLVDTWSRTWLEIGDPRSDGYQEHQDHI